ncbi:type IV toxin-antitoxin system AbiEi family antitoxin [Quadrisphaera sp. DSM 44207]|uniref:type IV toxin-antitoxin system AbiEi family antitoxin n=1 Tax=Quadrisphaera sp. DSM 44207 TaxID=1881057 RepID=UPI0008843B74|nr:type IV toxin-antitoxin system AbiEi family antitoxin [Quadrisphaera sp. DSM 44207]SDQ05627.1 hypothetical protein SAMN05428996_0239 [Quadrisphaera sp. DSM 44207]
MRTWDQPPDGPFERSDLDRLRIPRQQLAEWLALGAVVHPVRGVYLAERCAGDTGARAAALARRLPPGAAVARSTAAWLQGFDPRAPDQADAPLPLECVVPVGATPPRRPGVVARQSLLLPGDVVDVDGVPVTSPDRTALDLLRHLRPHMGLAVLDAMTAASAAAPDALLERLAGMPGQRSVARARRLVELCEPASESYGESWLRLRLVDAGFPRPEPQIWIHDRAGRGLYRLDLGWRERKVATEYDGVEFHGSPAARAADLRRRDRLAREHGWTVVGVGRGEVLGHSLALELGVGHLLGIAPTIRRRTW